MKQALFTLVLMGIPAAAHAESDPHWYGAASVDISLLKDTNGSIANAPTPGNTVRTFSPTQTGIGGQIAVGYDFGHVRIEVEGGYTRNTDNRYVAIVPPTGNIPADVKRTAFRGMVNGYYDFGKGRVQPYVGVGIGGLSGKVDFFAPRAPFPTEAPRQLINASDARFAYQLMAGVAIPVSRRLKLTAQYRWLDAGTLRPLDARGQQTTSDYRGHHIDLGLRIGF